MDVGTHSRGSRKRQGPETAAVRETRRRARQRYGRRRYAEDPEFRSWTLRRNAQNRRAQPDIWYGRYWFKHAALVKVRSHRRYVQEGWRRIESGDLVLDERGVSMPKPLPGGILRIRTFGPRW